MPHARPGLPRAQALVLVVVLVVGMATGCAGGSSTTATDPSTRTIEVSIADGTVTPEGERVPVSVGEQIALVIKSDTEGEVHVHADDATTEHRYRYQPGTTTCSFVVGRAGLVDVEMRGPERQLLVQLEVR